MTELIQIIDDCLEILEVPEIDESITELKTVDYTPLTQGNNNTFAAPITIDINASDSLILPSKSYLLIEGQLRRRDNDTPYNAGDEIALINNAMMYLFSDIKYTLGGTVLESIHNPGQTTTMLGYLRFPDDYNTNAGLHRCWAKDTSDNASSKKYNDSPQVIADQGAAAGDLTTVDNANYNQGFAVRKGFLMSSTPRGHFEFKIPLEHIFGFNSCYKKISWGIKHSLALTRGNDNLTIYRGNAVTDGKIDIRSIIWKMPTIQTDPVILTELRTNIINNKIIPLTYLARSCESTEVPQGAYSWTWNLAVPGGIEKPRWIIVGFQTNRNSTQEQNPAVFDNMNLNKAYVTLNSVKYPETDIDNNFNTNKYATLYDMFDNFKKEYDGLSELIGGNQVSYSAFKSLFPIIVFDVRKQNEKLKSGVVSIQLKFNYHNPVPANTHAYSIIISDRYLKQRSDGNNLTVITN